MKTFWVAWSRTLQGKIFPNPFKMYFAHPYGKDGNSSGPFIGARADIIRAFPSVMDHDALGFSTEVLPSIQFWLNFCLGCIHSSIHSLLRPAHIEMPPWLHHGTSTPPVYFQRSQQQVVFFSPQRTCVLWSYSTVGSSAALKTLSSLLNQK